MRSFLFHLREASACGRRSGWPAESLFSRAFRTVAGVCAVLLLPGVAAALTAGPDTLAALLQVLRRQGIEVAPNVLDRELKAAVVRAADPGGRVLTPGEVEQLRATRRGQKRGVGLRLEWSEGDLRVTAVKENSPAAQAGLVPGAVLDSVDGRFVTGRALDEVIRQIDDGDGETVIIDAVLPDEHEVRRFEAPRVLMYRLTVAVMEPWPRDLVYARLNGLHDDAAPAVASLLREAQEQRRFGVILDLRGASGDRVDAAAALAGLLSERPEGASLMIEALDGSTSEEFLAVAGERVRLRSIALIDGATAGAAELLAAILGVVDRGVVLIGEPTAGDSGLREAVPFSEDALLYVRTRRVLVNGVDVCEALGHAGVVPHITVQAAFDPTRAEEPSSVRRGRARVSGNGGDAAMAAWRERLRRDPVLERAVDVLLGLQALDPQADETEDHGEE